MQSRRRALKSIDAALRWHKPHPFVPEICRANEKSAMESSEVVAMQLEKHCATTPLCQEQFLQLSLQEWDKWNSWKAEKYGYTVLDSMDQKNIAHDVAKPYVYPFLKAR
jgi:hypothetical protein